MCNMERSGLRSGLRFFGIILMKARRYHVICDLQGSQILVQRSIRGILLVSAEAQSKTQGWEKTAQGLSTADSPLFSGFVRSRRAIEWIE